MEGGVAWVMLCPMKRVLTILAILTPLAAMAEAPAPLGPNGGKYGDWTAASYGSGPTKICYAFVLPKSSNPVLAKRGLTMLTVTQRPGSTDQVSFTPGFTYPATAAADMQIGRIHFPLYVANNVALTDNVTQAMIMFDRETYALVTSTGPNGKRYEDLFSLSGFSASYKAIAQACP